MVFEKLFKFIGKNIKSLVDRPDEPYCFRLQKNRVYYVRESLMKKATSVSVCARFGGGVRGQGRGSTGGSTRVIVPAPPAMQIARDKLIALGTCIGKMTHTGKFRLTVGALDILAQHAKFKVRHTAVAPEEAPEAVVGSWQP